MKRQHQFALVTSTLAFSWLAMQAVHEFGHIVAGVVSGGRVAQVILHPAAISYTLLAVNPHPLFVAWMGPTAGAALPIIALIVARALRWRRSYLFQFFAGFCLIANGAYLAFGTFGRIGDAGDMLRYGTPVWLLWLFGAVTIPIGLWLWHGVGSRFGLGASRGNVDRADTYVMFASLVILAALELIFSSPTVAP
jgi:hypothetical protein